MHFLVVTLFAKFNLFRVDTPLVLVVSMLLTLTLCTVRTNEYKLLTMCLF